MVVVFRLENVVLNFGFYKLGKADYPILNSSTEYLSGFLDREHAFVNNHPTSLPKVNERLLIKPYAKVPGIIREAMERGYRLMFASALNENFCRDFLEQLGMKDAEVLHSQEKLEADFLENMLSVCNEEKMLLISADLQEVAELAQSERIIGIAALWGTTAWLTQDFVVDGVLEAIGEMKTLWERDLFYPARISEQMKTNLQLFRDGHRDACFEKMLKTLMDADLLEDWENERRWCYKQGKCLFYIEEGNLVYGADFKDLLWFDWNNPFLRYLKTEIANKKMKRYLNIPIKTRKGLLHLYLQEINYIHLLEENQRRIMTPRKGALWTAREVALMKFYFRHKVFRKGKDRGVPYGPISLKYSFKDLECLMPGRTEAAISSKKEQLRLRMRVITETE